MTALGTARISQPSCPECGCVEWDVAIEATGEAQVHPESVEVVLRATGASCVCCGFAVRIDAESVQ